METMDESIDFSLMFGKIELWILVGLGVKLASFEFLGKGTLKETECCLDAAGTFSGVVSRVGSEPIAMVFFYFYFYNC